jgi:cytidyltransferase-like protein
VIIPTDRLAGHRGAVTMVDGAFDPIHQGHVDYFEAAAALGPPVLCNISPDDYVSRKHPPLLDQAARARVIDALRPITFTHLSQTSTNEVLRALVPRYYAKGADWRGRLPGEELATCAELGIEIVYLDTVVASSSSILDRLLSGYSRSD